MTNAADFRAGKHVVHRLHAHLVFTPKYRKPCLTDRVVAVLRAAFAGVCEDFDAELLESGHEADHVHLLVAYPPKLSLASLVNSLKGVSARLLRSQGFPEVRRALWGAAFWSPSYCAVSCGGAPLEIVRAYVEQQQGAGAASRKEKTRAKAREPASPP